MSLSAVLALPATAGPLAASTAPDLATTDGFRRTCAAQPVNADVLRTDDERLAWAICRDVDQVRQLSTWARRGMATINRVQPQDYAAVVAEVERKMDEVRAEMRRTRLQLERVQLGSRRSLRIAPGQWQVDLDGDGELSVWERHFFALPKRRHGEPQFGMPSDDAGHYERHYDLNAVIDLDQSDVLWALSYHQFIEGLLINVRAFDVDLQRRELVLARPALLRQAHGLIGRGLATSGRLRDAVLAETDDQNEWISHPRQVNSVFPIPLEAADFTTWRVMLDQVGALWHGRHLLPTTAGAGGLLGSLAPVCPAGQGLDIAKLYLQPPPAGTRASLSRLPAALTTMCRKVDAAHPLSPLPGRLERDTAGATGMSALRYLYWVN